MRTKIKKLIKTVLHMKGEPKKIAKAFAIGVFVAFFPIFGTHTIMALGVAWLLGLSPTVTLAATFINNPWTIAPLYGSSLYVGMILTGKSMSGLEIHWGELNSEVIWELAKTLFIPFSIGCILLGVIAAIISYFLALKAVVSYRNRQQTSASEPLGGS